MENETQASRSLQARLFELQDEKYRAFQQKLIPTMAKGGIIGVPMPALRKLARAFGQEPASQAFLACLPHRYYEENNLHGLLIEQIKDFSPCLEALNAFLPYVDNWATCDLLRPRALLTCPQALLSEIQLWLASSHPYTVRFGVDVLLLWFLGERFQPEHLEWVASLSSDEYYVKMAVAWYFATALTKQYDATLPYLHKRRLERWTHNKALQKARESLLISSDQKRYLQSLKIQ